MIGGGLACVLGCVIGSCWINAVAFPAKAPFEHECGLTGNVLEDSKALVFFSVSLLPSWRTRAWHHGWI